MRSIEKQGRGSIRRERTVALISESPRIQAAELKQLAEALRTQVMRDLAPIWNVSATIEPLDPSSVTSINDAQTKLESTYDLLRITTGDQAAEAHTFETVRGARRAVASVDDGPDYSLKASHELCEMLVDPYLELFIASRSISASQVTVRYQVEICDPCNGHSYEIDGVRVSDFYTPAYFDDEARRGARYSLNGSIRGPREILPGGYLDWVDDRGHNWHAENRQGRIWFTDAQAGRPVAP